MGLFVIDEADRLSEPEFSEDLYHILSK